MSDGGAPWERLAGARIFDLGQPMRVGMPQSPTHAPFRMLLEQRHGDRMREDGGSTANEVIFTGGHIGTHLDALCHVSQSGDLHGGVEARSVQSFDGFSRHGIEDFPPFVGRAVLLDIARLHGVAHLAAGYEITVEDLEAARDRAGLELREGDALLVGTGWSRRWDEAEPVAFAGTHAGAPGPGAAAGEWIAAHRPRLVGGETIAFEHIPAGRGHARLPVHSTLLVEAGIHILETMRLAELMDAGVTECLLIVSPLPIVGATGAPVRPLAIV